MKTRMIWALAMLLFATLPASAMSVREWESHPRHERSEFVVGAIDKIVADVAKVDPGLSKAVHDYFYVIPEGKPESPGLIAFHAELNNVEEDAKKGLLDLDKVQIEGILLEVIKLDVLPKHNAANNHP